MVTELCFQDSYQSATRGIGQVRSRDLQSRKTWRRRACLAYQPLMSLPYLTGLGVIGKACRVFLAYVIWLLPKRRISLTSRKHFVQVASSPTAPLHPWHGPNIMGASTRINDVFRYIKENLGAYWTEWVELHITGFSPLHFPPRPVWIRIEAFHVHISSHLADCDGLGAVRGEAMYRDTVLDAPYLQVIIRIRPPRLRWLTQAHLGKQ